jgi:hypothetical protein
MCVHAVAKPATISEKLEASSPETSRVVGEVECDNATIVEARRVGVPKIWSAWYGPKALLHMDAMVTTTALVEMLLAHCHYLFPSNIRKDRLLHLRWWETDVLACIVNQLLSRRDRWAVPPSKFCA